MNLIEATNYFLGESEESNSILDMASKILKMFKIDTSLFTDPTKAKSFLNNNQDSFDKAHSLYNKISGMEESYIAEGVFDIFRGIDKTTIAMFVFIAISGALGKAHASVEDLVNNMRDIASEVKVIDVDYNDSTHTGFQIKQTGQEDVKKILQGLDPAALQKIKDMAEEEGLDNWDTIKSNLKLIIAQSFTKDKAGATKRLNGLDAHDLEILVNSALRKVK